ncbi:MAG TPA: PilZ domain-containing protein [Pyrinomonadaceae bacterium]|nr:PilZ domain-containing protein [Pyrinomonadaceae bacterium]
MKASKTTRRVFRRRAVQLQASIRFKPAASFTASGDKDRLTLVGRTRDISETGMALLVSAKNIDRYLTRKENGFDVELRLPDGAVELEASPVYFKKSTTGAVATYLIGCRFLTGQNAHVSRLIAFLRSLPVN